MLYHVTALISFNLNSTTARQHSVFIRSNSRPFQLDKIFWAHRILPLKKEHLQFIRLFVFYAQGLPQVIINLTNQKQHCIQCIMS